MNLKEVSSLWDCLNFLSVGQLYLNEAIKTGEKITEKIVKKEIKGHWGTVPGINFILAHINRINIKYKINPLLVIGPGHGAVSLLSQAYLDGTLQESIKDITYSSKGLSNFFRNFGLPYHQMTHLSASVPGSVHEGGELGYSLSHAFGTVFNNPNLITICIVGDGEAETAPISNAWHSNKYLDVINDGCVLPILHLNGFKIHNPTVFSTISDEELILYFRGMGWEPILIDCIDKDDANDKMSKALDKSIELIQRYQFESRSQICLKRYHWPMIIFRSPKGWTGPNEVDGKIIEGSYNAHRIPLDMSKQSHYAILENWLKSYNMCEYICDDGSFNPVFLKNMPLKKYQITRNVYSNSGLIKKDLILPDIRSHIIELNNNSSRVVKPMENLNRYLLDLIRIKENERIYRIFGPDETDSNGLGQIIEFDQRSDNELILGNKNKSKIVLDSMLSEHMCEGWLEGYLLSGKQGVFVCYEAFAGIVGTMVLQFSKWILESMMVQWRKPIFSLNILLTSVIWQQSQNGISHQDASFLNMCINIDSKILRIYFPVDANELTYVFHKTCNDCGHINIIVASKRKEPLRLDYKDIVSSYETGYIVYNYYNVSESDNPDIILLTYGTIPVNQCIKAVEELKEQNPHIKVRLIIITELNMFRFDNTEGISNDEYYNLIPVTIPVLVVSHGFPTLIYSVLGSRISHNYEVLGFSYKAVQLSDEELLKINNIHYSQIMHKIIMMVKS